MNPNGKHLAEIRNCAFQLISKCLAHSFICLVDPSLYLTQHFARRRRTNTFGAECADITFLRRQTFFGRRTRSQRYSIWYSGNLVFAVTAWQPGLSIYWIILRGRVCSKNLNCTALDLRSLKSCHAVVGVVPSFLDRVLKQRHQARHSAAIVCWVNESLCLSVQTWHCRAVTPPSQSSLHSSEVGGDWTKK